MKTLFFALLLISTQVSAAPLACENKLQSLEAQGLHRGAFLQALKNYGKSDKPSRYLTMAKLGRENDGTLQLIDLQSGTIRDFAMAHGFPENHPQMTEHKKIDQIFFGGMSLEPTREEGERHYRTITKPLSPSLKNKLADQSQYILACSDRFKNIVPKGRMNAFCLKPQDFQEFNNILVKEKDAQKDVRQIFFAYPAGRNTDLYLKSVQLPNDAPDVCGFLSKMPEPAKGGAPAGDAQKPPGKR